MQRAASSVLFGLAFLSCATNLPRCPAVADDYAVRQQGRTNESFWFGNAIIQTSYHTASIAPYDIVNDADKTYLVDRLTMSEKMCSSERTTLRALRQSRFLRVVAHGHFDERGTTLIMDCLCSAEPVMETPGLVDRMEPLFGR